MARLEFPAPARMCRVAIAALSARLRPVLVELAREGAVELAGVLPPPEGAARDALRRVEGGAADGHGVATVSATEPDLGALEERRDRDLLAGEVELDRCRRAAITQGDVSVLVGWTPEQRLDQLRTTLSEAGAALVDLPRPRSEIPPTLLRSTKVAAPFRILVDTYGVLPYSDVDPTAFAAIAFVVMFGMMFGDVGHGLLLMLGGLALARTHHGAAMRARPSWPLLVAAGGSGVVFGFLYGECFGPTGIVPTLWIAPLDEPLVLLEAAVVVGSTLLAVSYFLGSANRWRERGFRSALYAEGGLAGGLMFVGVAIAVAGWIGSNQLARIAGIVTSLLGVAFLFAGTFVTSGRGLGGLTQAFIEVMDVLVRIGSNVVSFTRLAAFGMTHAALSLVTFEGARDLAGGPVGWGLAVLLFVIGTAVALALEGMVATIQALRLEYYELFSRIFVEEGRPFTPFAHPVRPAEDMT